MKKFLGAAVVGSMLWLACGSATGPEGKPGPAGVAGTDGTSALLTITPESAGTNCPSGGVKIEAGVDQNKNGVLDSTEIDSTQYLCNGATGPAGANGDAGTSGSNGLNSLILTTFEDAGVNCASGGQRIDVGTDDNRNTALESFEIDATAYACDGNGGRSALVNISPIGTGAACPSGGNRIDVGIDDNGDGVLQGSEIDKTSYICNGSAGLSAYSTGAPDAGSVFNTPTNCYFFPNNLTNGIWHRASNKLITGYYSTPGYWSFLAGAGGYPNAPNNDTAVNYGRMVQVPDTSTVIRGGGASPGPSAASTIMVGTIDGAGNIGGFATAVFSDGFAGNCNMMSSSQQEFLCWDGAVIRHYWTNRNSPALTFNKSVTPSPLPPLCNGSCWGGTFAWDGTYYYFADAPNSSAGRNYSVYAPDGTRQAGYTAAGTGNINSIYFDWSVGQYATHDGYGARSGTNNFIWVSGAQSDDSQCYSPSVTHALP